MPGLEIADVSCDLGGRRVLDRVSLDVAEGELVAIVGPSGCGKSTLLRIVAGLVAPAAGSVRIGGRAVDELEPGARDVAMVFQSYALYPHMTVRGNLEFPLRNARLPRPEIEARVAEAARLLDLADLLDRKPGALSGGQMQRVALGRALVRRPKVFLFDEPLSNLDVRLRVELRGEIARLHAELGATALYVTHDQAEAMTLGSRVCVLDRGVVEQVGPPLEVWARPRTAFVAAFVGSPAMNLLTARVEGGIARVGALEVDLGLRDGRSTLLLGIRPGDVALERPSPAQAGHPVVRVEHLGSECHVDLDVGGVRLRATLPGRLRPVPGDRWQVRLPPARIHRFDPESGRSLATQ